jgi:hypothetical protein
LGLIFVVELGILMKTSMSTEKNSRTVQKFAKRASIAIDHKETDD